MAKITDFDKYIDERRAKSPTFTLFGEEYKLPPTIPFAALLYLQAMVAGEADYDMLKFFEVLFGNEETVTKWKTHPDFDIDLVNHITGWVLDQYKLTSPKQESPQS